MSVLAYLVAGIGLGLVFLAAWLSSLPPLGRAHHVSYGGLATTYTEMARVMDAEINRYRNRSFAFGNDSPCPICGKPLTVGWVARAGYDAGNPRTIPAAVGRGQYCDHIPPRTEVDSLAQVIEREWRDG